MPNVSDITEHLTLNRRNCSHCGSRLVRKAREVLKDWRARKYCDAHCRARHAKAVEPATRFAKYVDRSAGRGPHGDCHEWIGHLNSKGYGRLRVGNKMMLAHRFAWLEAHGNLPDELDVCHKCDNPLCVRVGHLFLGTHEDNMRDMAAKGRAHAPQGADHYNYRITSALRQRIAADTRSRAEVAAEYEVSRGYVSALRRLARV